MIVPVTTQGGGWTEANPRLYPRLPAGSGIRAGAAVLCDQLRSCDVRRVIRYLGTLPQERLATVQQGVRAALRLD